MRLRSCIASLTLEGLGQITASFGIAEFGTAERVKYWIDRADQALYQAKQQGRNTVYVAPRAWGRPEYEVWGELKPFSQNFQNSSKCEFACSSRKHSSRCVLPRDNAFRL